MQDVIRRIFDVTQMKAALLEFEIDTDKMPLGKLTKQHLQVSSVYVCVASWGLTVGRSCS